MTEHIKMPKEAKAWIDDAAAALPDLPDLRADELAVKGRAPYRHRHHTELEPAQWYGAPCRSEASPAQASCAGEGDPKQV